MNSAARLCWMRLGLFVYIWFSLSSTAQEFSPGCLLRSGGWGGGLWWSQALRPDSCSPLSLLLLPFYYCLPLIFPSHSVVSFSVRCVSALPSEGGVVNCTLFLFSIFMFYIRDSWHWMCNEMCNFRDSGDLFVLHCTTLSSLWTVSDLTMYKTKHGVVRKLNYIIITGYSHGDVRTSCFSLWSVKMN